MSESTRTRRGRSTIKLAPPRDSTLFETQQDWETQHELERTNAWHHLPLALVALPPLLSIIHGRAENWSDAILLLLVAFYLYQLVKVPWEMYYASTSRKVLPSTISTVEEEEEDPVLVRQRLESSTILRRNELLSLLTTFLVPCLGAYLLNYIRGLLSDPERYVNDSLIQMFMIATSVKPFLHFVKLLKRQSLYHQELVHYPNTQVHDLKLKLNKLESDLIQLSRAFATKSDIRALRDGVDVPLSQLSKALKRFSKKEEYLRLTSSEKFQLLEQRLEQVTELAEKQQEVLQEIELERRERELQEKEQRKGRKYNNSELDFGNFLGRLLSSVVVSTTTSNSYNDDDDQIKGTNKQNKKWYERGLTWYVFWPITVPKSTIGWVLEKSGNAVKKIERGFVEETKEELNLNHNNASLRGGGGGGGNNEKSSTRRVGVAGGSRRRNNALKA